MLIIFIMIGVYKHFIVEDVKPDIVIKIEHFMLNDSRCYFDNPGYRYYFQEGDLSISWSRRKEYPSLIVKYKKVFVLEYYDELYIYRKGDWEDLLDVKDQVEVVPTLVPIILGRYAPI